MIDLFHLVDSSVAFDATDAAAHMHGVVEIDEIRHAMNLDPGYGPPALRALAHQFQPRVVLEHLVVAFMQVELAGIFEYQDRSTALWQ